MNSRVSSYFFFVLLLGAAVAAALLFLPFLTPLMLAAAGAVILYPIYCSIAYSFGNGEKAKTFGGIITVILFIVVIIVPLFFLISSLYYEIQTLYAMLTDEANRSQVIGALNTLSQTLSSMVFGAVPVHSFDSFNITAYLKDLLQIIFSNLDNIFAGAAVVVGYIVVFLLAMFYFLRDGLSLKRLVMSWSPLLQNNEEYISQTFKRAIRSVFAGSLSVSLIQGISTGLAFYVFGIPGPILWGVCGAVASLVPGFGVSLLILPGTAYLILTGNYLYAAGLFIWGYTVILTCDHILGPALMNRGIHIHPFLILLSVLGGILFYGIVGFVMGPMILVLLFTLLEIYKKSFDGRENEVVKG